MLNNLSGCNSMIQIVEKSTRTNNSVSSTNEMQEGGKKKVGKLRFKKA